MSSEKSFPPENASQRIHLPSLIGFKTFPDDGLPLHTDSHVRARVPRSWKRGWILVVGFLCILLVLVRNIRLFSLTSTRPPTTPPSGLPSTRPHRPLPPNRLVVADHGAVAADHIRCSDIGVEVLQEGGNAVEAAISAALCLGVVNMFSSGIGGGGFMTVRVPPEILGGTSEVFTVDFRETAPGLANMTMFVNNATAAKYDGLAVGVPGELRGFEEAYRRWGGNSTWLRLFRPSVELADNWTVDAELAKRIHLPEFSDLMHHNEDWSAIFAPRGTLLRENQNIQRRNYARTLDKIAHEGAQAFYEGEIADSIVRKVHEKGGFLTHADLEHYTVKVERALEGTYRGNKVYTSHVPTSGPVLLHMLNLLERFDWTGGPWEPLNAHRVVEAMKFGFAARTRIGDLPYYTGNETRVTEIPTKEFANRIAVNLTDDRTHEPEYYNPEFDVVVDHGTTHLSVVDKNGMAVALTTTVNYVFGSQVLDPETGIILNNEMADFSIPGTSPSGSRPSPHNYPQPGKRPLSSVTPTILEYANGSFYLAVGASGGPQILTATLQTLLNVDSGMDASQAVEHVRVHHQLYPNRVDADKSQLPQGVLDGLRERRHNVTDWDSTRPFAVAQTVVKKDGKIYAASDSRKNGFAAGY